MIVAGALLVLAPRERFTPAYEFILAVPAGQYLAGGTYIAVGLSLVYAMIVGHQSGMSRGLFVGGVLGMLFGVVLLFGTATGGKGVVFWLFAIYTGLHMLLQSALVSTRRAA